MADLCCFFMAIAFSFSEGSLYSTGSAEAFTASLIILVVICLSSALVSTTTLSKTVIRSPLGAFAKATN